jgi:uncharacterized protein YggU (UPF0235/DUF167 family)
MPAFTPTTTGIRLYLRVTPNAGRDGVDGVETRDNGEAVLRVRVAAVPDKGKANVAAIALVARALGCPRSSITLVSGETARFKTLLVTGDPVELASKMVIIESSGA